MDLNILDNVDFSTDIPVDAAFGVVYDLLDFKFIFSHDRDSFRKI